MSTPVPADETVQPAEVPEEVTTRERLIIRHWARVAATLLLIAGSFAIAYLRAASAADTATTALHSAKVAAAKAKVASDRAQATAKCVNAVLAIRNKTATDDATANLEFVRAVTSLFVLNSHTPQAVSRSLVAEFKATSIRTLSTLKADDLIRKQNPLGQC